MGDSEQFSLRVGGNTILLRFDINSLAKEITITSATFKLFTYVKYCGTSMITGVFRSSHGEPTTPILPTTGTTEGYTMDLKIDKNQQVVFTTSFESTDWQDEWSYAGGTIDVIGDDLNRQFSPLDGKALRALIPMGETSSMSVIY